MTCEDAPCCGCCGTGVYGRNDYDYSLDSEFGTDRYDAEDDYYGDQDYIDPANCSHDSDFDNIDPIAGTVTCWTCDTDGVCFSIMGQNVYRFPVTVSDDLDYGNEDAAMEYSLFGDC